MKQRISVSDSIFSQLTLVAIIFLPFTKALTLPVGFPLKGYEIILPIAIFFLLIRGKITEGNGIESFISLAIAFFLIALISTLSGQFYNTADASLDYRGGRLADGLMRSVYLLFNILSLLVAFNVARKFPRTTVNAWFIGLIFSFSYHILAVILFISNGDAPLLPGLDRHQLGWVGSVLIPRSGTFEEGNFAGLYYFISLALAAHVGNRFMILLATCGVLLTLSTSTYLTFAAFTLLYLLRKKGLSFVNLAWITFALILILLIFIQLDTLSKFGEDAGSSGAVRFNESMTGLQIFLAHPFLGVGLGGYGYYFDAYEWDSALSIFFDSKKHIANNVYIEILAETGVFGLALFIASFYAWLKIIRNGGPKLDSFFAAAISMLIALIAYPTFNITYIWVFIGISSGIAGVSSFSIQRKK